MVGLVQLLRAHNVYYELIVIPDDMHESLLHSRWIDIFSRSSDFLHRFVWEKQAPPAATTNWQVAETTRIRRDWPARALVPFVVMAVHHEHSGITEDEAGRASGQRDSRALGADGRRRHRRAGAAIRLGARCASGASSSDELGTLANDFYEPRRDASDQRRRDRSAGVLARSGGAPPPGPWCSAECDATWSDDGLVDFEVAALVGALTGGVIGAVIGLAIGHLWETRHRRGAAREPPEACLISSFESKRRPTDRPRSAARAPTGPSTWQRQDGKLGAFFPLHDLTHYAVETVLGFRRAFYGLLAEGWDLSSFGEAGTEGRLPEDAESRRIDRRLLRSRTHHGQRERAPTNSTRRSATYSPTTNFRRRRFRVDDDQLANIRRVRDELFARWRAVPAGETLELPFDRDSTVAA